MKDDGFREDGYAGANWQKGIVHGPDGGSGLIAAGLKRNAGMVVPRDERDYGTCSMTLDMPPGGAKGGVVTQRDRKSPFFDI